MGSTETSSTTEMESESGPWKHTKEPLKRIIGQIDRQIPRSRPTVDEGSALNQLEANAKAGNPFTDNTFNLAKQLFAGGTDRTGIASGAYGDLRTNMSPYASGSHMGPDGNPALKGYLDVSANDVSNRINSMFAGAGRDFSGAHVNNLARGITEGQAPILANQYNQDVGRQFDANNTLYNAGNSTAGVLSGLDQTALGNQQAGIGVGQQALQARDSSANQLLDVESRRRNLPLGNIGNLSGLLTPLAQLGTQQSGSSTTNTTSTPPLGMQVAQVGAAFKGPGAGWGGGK